MVLVPLRTAPFPVEAETVTSLVALVTRLPETSSTLITGCVVKAIRLLTPATPVSIPRRSGAPKVSVIALSTLVRPVEVKRRV